MDFSDVFDNPCNVGAILCGPPTVEFFGGGGSGAAGNAIISAAGEIMGVDITLPGSNYTSAPFVRFVDACGKGKDSAQLLPGFGGLLDLLDSPLFAAPVALAWWYFQPPVLQ